MFDFEDLKVRFASILKINKEDIKNIYIYGSKVYGTSKPNSDIDVMVIVNDSKKQLNCLEKRLGLFDLHINTEEEFRKNLNEHHIKALENIFSSSEYKYEEINFKKDFKLDLKQLRNSISKISNNSWAKAQKKITIDYEDTYIGFKSLWHCLRIVNLGTQIATEKQIVDYSYSNHLWDEIYSEYCEQKDWDYLKEKYKPLYNSLMTTFRIAAPK